MHAVLNGSRTRLAHCGVYEERASMLRGGRVWTSRSAESPSRVLPDGCMDLMWMNGHLVVAGPDRVAFGRRPVR